VIGSGSGHPSHDREEMEALRRVFTGTDRGPFLYSPKSLMGDFDGMGGIKAIAGALALTGQVAWPNRFLRGPLEHEGLELPDALEQRDIQRLLVVSMAVGGAGIALLLQRPEVGG
jgi:3-oxoacyl-(acyl-carrier-protein) synthase